MSEQTTTRANVRTVNLRYHQEDDGWWVESPDLVLTAGDPNLGEARQLAKGAVRFALGEAVAVIEWGLPGEPASS